MKIKIWSVLIPHYFNTPLLADFLYLLHLRLRVLWTSPSWSLLETSFSRLYMPLSKLWSLPVIWLYQCLT